MDITTKDELINRLSEKTGFIKKDSKLVLDALIEILTEQVKNREKFDVRGFGRVRYVRLPARKGFKPNMDGTGEFMDYPGADKIIFSLSDDIRKYK